MYAEEVFLSLNQQQNYLRKLFDKSSLKEVNKEPIFGLIPKLKNDIHNAHKFNFGEYRRWIPLLPPDDDTRAELFPYAKLPYRLCWFDFDLYGQKSGLLVQDKGAGLFYSFSFNHYNDGNEQWQWELNPIANYFTFGLPLDQFEDVSRLPEFKSAASLPGFAEAHNSKRLCIMPKLLSPRLIDLDNDIDRLRNSMQASKEDILALFCFLILLNCKNITYAEERNPITKKMRKKRENDLPMFTYHILKLSLPPGKSSTGGSGEGGKKRYHFCRGHFKLFTLERPLFGKYVGLYWWQAHIRGQNRNGIVTKDYKIDPRKED